MRYNSRLSYCNIVYSVAMQLCLASILFPVGFGSPEVGGMAFKLPPNNSLGSSYVCFILAILFTLFGGLCMRKVRSTRI